MRKYGYILDETLFKPKGDDVQWSFKRYNQDGSTTDYNGIDTKRDLSKDKNVVIIGTAKKFKLWIREFLPPIE